MNSKDLAESIAMHCAAKVHQNPFNQRQAQWKERILNDCCLEEFIDVARSCIELLHDGCPIPNPSTGDAEPFQANPQNAIDAINKLRAKLLEKGITL